MIAAQWSSDRPVPLVWVKLSSTSSDTVVDDVQVLVDGLSRVEDVLELDANPGSPQKSCMTPLFSPVEVDAIEEFRGGGCHGEERPRRHPLSQCDDELWPHGGLLDNRPSLPVSSSQP